VIRHVTRHSVAYGVTVLLLVWGQAYADTNRSDSLVVDAAGLFSAIQFDSASEELALRHLAEALAEDPSNREAQQLAEAIQRRRSEREEQERQEGQQHIDQQQEQQQDEQSQPPDTDEQTGDEPDDEEASERDDRIEQPEERESEQAAPPENRSEDEMTQEEAIRLLDALEAQEKTPQVRPHKQGGSRGPRW